MPQNEFPLRHGLHYVYCSYEDGTTTGSQMNSAHIKKIKHTRKTVCLGHSSSFTGTSDYILTITKTLEHY